MERVMLKKYSYNVSLAFRVAYLFRYFERKMALIARSIESYALRRACPNEWQEIQVLSDKIIETLRNTRPL